MKTIRFRYDAIEDVVNELCALKPLVSVFTFEGELGTGKTTTIRHILRHFGIAGMITSPTFTYVNTYANPEGDRFYHFDLYRLKSAEEFTMMGFTEYLYQEKSWAFIEWPEIVLPTITHNACYCTLSLAEAPDERILSYRLSSDISTDP